MQKIEKLTEAQIAKMPEWVEKHIQMGLSTEPADFDKANAAVLRAYELLNLKKPMVVLRVGSPFACTVGGALAFWMLKQLKESKISPKVGAQVGAQVWAQVWDQVWAQVRDQVGDQVWAQVRDQVGALAKDGISNNYGGQLYHANWVAFVTFMRDVVGVEIHEKFSIESDLAESCGWVWWHENVLAISDRPKLIQRDDRGRLHSETGPAIACRDGWALHFWHGVSIPPEWIENKASLTPQMALGWSNVEQRRAACEILGWSHILRELDAKVLDKDADEEIGTLVEVNLPDAGKQKFLQVRCGTGRQFALPVPREMKTAKQSNAWTYGLDASEFKPEVRT